MPRTLDHFKEEFPRTWTAYEQLRNACDTEGPLDRKVAELIKIGISTALEHEGGLIAHVSQARKAGATEKEIEHAILVATGLAGFPAVLQASELARDYLEAQAD
ncbi:carboxymuconolactone decarboxylase [Sulfurifustis variabilis]|uniref:Carboxymuconolactone decarboxylase n=1 Tax=Sulfurifustis variabilis TaxID=1675686 RepID=A0A1B4V7D6_9GAMM|nr:carboxymuconolactone decarboxylase family protein [Sulfurifustis variabilis]BAU49375.1 carboxymuconolactone decarboxylase [Sulfurifustis variabilis]